jgi:hypothetical protein
MAQIVDWNIKTIITEICKHECNHFKKAPSPNIWKFLKF